MEFIKYNYNCNSLFLIYIKLLLVCLYKSLKDNYLCIIKTIYRVYIII